MKKKNSALFFIVLLLSVLCLSSCGNKDDGGGKSREPFNFTDGQFKIIQMTDFHEWLGIEGSWLSIEHQDNLKPLLESYISFVLEQEKPDLVVLTGDNVFSLSYVSDLVNSISIKTYEVIAKLFESKKQYWTMTFGNHDSESKSTKNDFLNAVKQNPYFVGGTSDTDYYRQFIGADDRLCNFSIPIYDNGEVKYNVYLLDSGSYNKVQSSSVPYKYITGEQADWYASEAARLKELNGGNAVPSLMFTHIPLFEHLEAYNGGGARIGEWLGFSPSDTRSSIFEKGFSNGDIRGIFTGHNHSNSISVFYERDSYKIMMGITPQTAAASYTDTDSVLYSRVIILSTDGNFTTYIHTSEANSTVNGGMPHPNVFRQEILSYN